MPPTLTTRDRRLTVSPVVFVEAQDTAGFPFRDRTHAVDVSGSGLSFLTAHDVPVGAVVALKILIPRPWRYRFAGRAVYSVRGVVRRRERSARDGRFRVAVRFVGDDR